MAAEARHLARQMRQAVREHDDETAGASLEGAASGAGGVTQPVVKRGARGGRLGRPPKKLAAPTESERGEPSGHSEQGDRGLPGVAEEPQSTNAGEADQRGAGQDECVGDAAVGAAGVREADANPIDVGGGGGTVQATRSPSVCPTKRRRRLVIDAAADVVNYVEPSVELPEAKANTQDDVVMVPDNAVVVQDSVVVIPDSGSQTQHYIHFPKGQEPLPLPMGGRLHPSHRPPPTDSFPETQVVPRETQLYFNLLSKPLSRKRAAQLAQQQAQAQQADRMAMQALQASPALQVQQAQLAQQAVHAQLAQQPLPDVGGDTLKDSDVVPSEQKERIMSIAMSEGTEDVVHPDWKEGGIFFSEVSPCDFGLEEGDGCAQVSGDNEDEGSPVIVCPGCGTLKNLERYKYCMECAFPLSRMASAWRRDAGAAAEAASAPAASVANASIGDTINWNKKQ